MSTGYEVGNGLLSRTRRFECLPGAPRLYKTLRAAVYGIDAHIIEVEVDVSRIKMTEDHSQRGLPEHATERLLFAVPSINMQPRGCPITDFKN
jgi:hypothetical protein